MITVINKYTLESRYKMFYWFLIEKIITTLALGNSLF